MSAGHFFIHPSMKKTFILAAAALVLVSCGQKKVDPVKDTITQYIAETLSYDDVKFINLEKVDSTTFREEFEHRKNAFEARRASDEKFIVKYMNEGKQKNAALKTESFKNTLRIIRDLDSLEKASAAILDDIAYYDYKFNASARGPQGSMDFKDAYVCMTPDMKVMSMTSNVKDLHKSLGRVIPGYLDIVKGEEEGSEDPEEEL